MSKGIFNPWASKNLYIAILAACGLAVNMNWSFNPYFLALSIASSNNGPGLPSLIISNSVKSNSPPCSNISAPSLANSSALNLPFTYPLVKLSILLATLDGIGSPCFKLSVLTSAKLPPNNSLNASLLFCTDSWVLFTILSFNERSFLAWFLSSAVSRDVSTNTIWTS